MEILLFIYIILFLKKCLTESMAERSIFLLIIFIGFNLNYQQQAHVPSSNT